MTCAQLTIMYFMKKKIEKKKIICIIGDRSRDLVITSKRSNHLSYLDTHNSNMTKSLIYSAGGGM